MKRIYAELTKLINIGYPLLNGAAFLGITLYFSTKLTFNILAGSLSPVHGITAIVALLIFGGGFGTLLIKIGIEAQRK